MVSALQSSISFKGKQCHTATTVVVLTGRVSALTQADLHAQATEKKENRTAKPKERRAADVHSLMHSPQNPPRASSAARAAVRANEQAGHFPQNAQCV